jgi:hypothetical protein
MRKIAIALLISILLLLAACAQVQAAPTTDPSGVLTRAQVMELASDAGFTAWGLTEIVKIAYAESGFNTQARLVDADGSIDRGLYQINSYWHSEVSDACSYDAWCATQQAYRISKQGTDFSQWTSYEEGKV